MKLYKIKQRFKKLWRSLSLKDEPKISEKVAKQSHYKKKPKRIKRCHTTYKFMFTREQAMKRKEILLQRRSAEYLRVYNCQFCGKWHLTHKKNYLGR